MIVTVLAIIIFTLAITGIITVVIAINILVILNCASGIKSNYEKK